MMKFALDIVENIAGKGENMLLYVFSLFLIFSKGGDQVVKTRDYVVLA